MDITNIIKVLRNRARNLTMISVFILFATATIMGSAGWLFFNAAEIAAKDIQTPDSRAYQIELETLTEELGNLRKLTISDALRGLINRFKSKSDYVLEQLSNDSLRLRKSYGNLYQPVERDLVIGGYSFMPYSTNSLITRLNIDLFLPEIPKGMVFDDHDQLYIILSIDERDYEELIKIFDISKEGVRASIDGYANLVSATKDLQGQWTNEINASINKFKSNKSKVETLKQRTEELKKIILISTNYKLAAKYGIELSGVKADDVSKSQENNIYFLLSTNIIRFGPMIIIFFFANVLINLYRYCLRLSAYYHARADALELLELEVDCDKFNSLTDLLSPESYDLGKAPKSPLDQAVEIAKLIKVNSSGSNKT